MVGCQSMGDTNARDGDPELEARQQAYAEYIALTTDVQKLTHRSPEDQLNSARQRAEGLENLIVSIRGTSAVDKARLEATRAEIKFLDAALAVKKKRDQVMAMIEQAKLTPAQKRKSTSEKRALLREQWPEFRTSDDELITAERAYDDASSNLLGALKTVQAYSAPAGIPRT